ncbi:cytoskeletal protein CcmA (bactofilin family) [Rhizomicrobium palustre]|uniref:Cytoskeletal protein CcmA (Bactofilin family) n=1 Tax=Rhizomicrobium palustre TaxID=189966 RepID=A0A846MV12_9PROT|nr:polymer-forming cytoskeletal protein [Rhizomicrobium palustre]NIK86942.1 cytoskeletal protein CcmA (bactofilin family) [Rhizomicrobium palustre]
MSSMFTRNDPPKPDVKPPAPAPEIKQPEPPPAPDSVRRAQVAAAQPLTPPSQMSGKGVSVISRALRITGQLESSEDIEILGEVEGDVRAATVRVGTGAKVRGTVSGEEVELAGSVEGKIEARKVVLTNTAHMAGDIIHQDVAIQSGAYINGHLKPEYGKGNVQQLKAKAE